MRRLLRIAAVAIVPLIWWQESDATPVVSAFNSSDEGWMLSGDPSSPVPEFVANGGNPGGHIKGTDGLRGVDWLFVAPDKFLGNQADKKRLSFDLNVSGNGDLILPRPDVILEGSGLQLSVDAGGPPIPRETWISFTVPLDTSAGWRLGGGDLLGPLATEAQIQDVLASLDLLSIRGDHIFDLDMGRLDNVILRAAPEPSTLTLFGFGFIGFAGLGVARRRLTT